MDNTEKLISIYHTGFIACLVLMLLGIALAVMLFFMFDIRNIFLLRTGRAKQKTIDEMQARNLKTGKLSVATPYTDSGELKKKDEKRRTGALKLPGAKKVTIEPPKNNPNVSASQLKAPSGETELLKEPAGGAGNGVQSAEPFKDPLQTAVLQPEKRSAEPVVAKPGFRFTVTERVIVTHTTEII